MPRDETASADGTCNWCGQQLRRTQTPFRVTYRHHYGTEHLCPGPQGTNGVMLSNIVLGSHRERHAQASAALAAQLRELASWLEERCRCGAPPAWYEDGEPVPCGGCEVRAGVLGEGANTLDELERSGMPAPVTVVADWHDLRDDQDDEPDQDETVWLYDAGKYGVVLGEHTGTRWTTYFNDPGLHVTHWAPLNTPQPPKGPSACSPTPRT